jgi:hypothetical protein
MIAGLEVRGGTDNKRTWELFEIIVLYLVCSRADIWTMYIVSKVIEQL